MRRTLKNIVTNAAAQIQRLFKPRCIDARPFPVIGLLADGTPAIYYCKSWYSESELVEDLDRFGSIPDVRTSLTQVLDALRRHTAEIQFTRELQ